MNYDGAFVRNHSVKHGEEWELGAITHAGV